MKKPDCCYLALPTCNGIIHGSTKPLQPPVENMDDVWNEHEKAAILQMMQYSFVGGPATVRKGYRHL
jgi:hypothetical protein